MKTVTSAQMREIDEQTSARFGVPSMLLMENAGASLCDIAMSEFSTKSPVIVCGKGGNGGDGFVCARHLAMEGIQTKVFLLCKSEELTGDQAINFGILAKGFSGFIELHVGETDQNLGKLSQAVKKADLIIDCLLGTGLLEAPKGAIAQAIELVNSVNLPVLSCDIPSGVDGSTGKVPGLAVQADVTCTFGLPKIGHLLYPGASMVGKLLLTNVGFPKVLLDDPYIEANVLTAQEASWLLPERTQSGHKGSFGKILIVGGSAEFPGAPILSGLGSLRGGSGLTTVIVPESIYQSVAGRYPEMIVKGAPSDEYGAFSEHAAEHVLKAAFDASCIVIGPGLSRAPGLSHFIGEVLGKIEIPVIVDADALNVLSKSPGSLLLRAEHGWPTILTPHWGEAGRFGTAASDVTTDPIATARRFSNRYGSITVLKSARTIIASPSGQYYINTTGNSALSKGGSGDVLSGFIASLVSQGLSPFDASVLGCHLFGFAGEMTSKEHTEYGTMSTDVANSIPKAIQEVLSQ
ncbi:MAG TPA: NAD(P)H-hydrate dehydratase [Caldisericia bacterium]|nr:NAD(P)H-hydrate dehydratase [Caldisericia bacterium]HOR46593.1 NAD(P)H-hydrate dehydratase [Caldisericia bacterium]HOU08396.1 NAD(P)H-hydrate dehydratase [Caldisericia bacterium]HPL89541.1 NAD(P)H-hydrate dehydratase [Caldisericia bacterium]HQG59759.1 NAD(P)H-hydrate dehydratase [Caldisericia bacterium]